MSETITVASEGLLLDEILARRFGAAATRRERWVERTLELNPGLAETVTLPVGTRIALPEREAEPAGPSAVDLFALFDEASG